MRCCLPLLWSALASVVWASSLSGTLHGQAASPAQLPDGSIGTGAVEPLPPNPFAVFESVRLPNGMKLWYGHLPGATTTSMAVTVPFGRDQDPHGREQTAHLLEHVLLSDRPGGAEAELARELTRRGGTHNAVTGPWYTHFLLGIGTDEAAFGVQWLHDVVAPRPFSDDLVDRNRLPVSLELNARGSALLPRGVAAYLFHPRLRPAGFWRREFGLDAQEERGADQRAGLAAVTAAELRAFYDAYYSPSEMTLVIVSGVPRSALQPVLDSTFAALPWRPPPTGAASPVRASSGERRFFAWHAGRSTRIAVRYRLPELDARDHLRLIFVEDLLRHRLMERLRRGDAKVAYSVTAATVIRGPAAVFAIEAEVGPRQERHVRDVIEEEIRRLAHSGADTAAFYGDRDALARRLRIENASPAALRHWATERFSRPGMHDAFPDVGSYYATLGHDAIAEFAERLLVPDNRSLQTVRPLPLPPWLILVLAGLVCLAAARLYRRLFLAPVRLSTIRFVTRVRPPAAARLVAGAAVLAATLLAGRAAIAAVHIGAANLVLPLGSFFAAAAAAAVLLFLATFTALGLLGLVPRKILVFSDHVRLKATTCRAVIIPAADIRGARAVSAHASLRLRIPVVPPRGDGVFLELQDGSGYLLRSRRPAELLRALNDLLDARERTMPAADAALPAPPELALSASCGPIPESAGP